MSRGEDLAAEVPSLAFDASTTVEPPLAVAVRLRQSFAEDAARRDRAGGRPHKEVAQLKDSGLLKLHVPRELGGAGEPWSTILRIVREFARTDGSISHLFGYHFHWMGAVSLKSSPDQSARLQRRSVEDNWFWGNASNSFSHGLIGKRVGGRVQLSGRHPFSSGAHVADYLYVAWDETETGKRGFAALPADRKGIEILDDWDGFGQTQTGSGTVLFHDVWVEAEDELAGGIDPASPRATLYPLIAQNILLNVFLGSAQGALCDARTYTMTRSHPWLTSGVASVADDPWIKRTYGELWTKAEAATLMADRAMGALDAACARGAALTAEERGEAAVVIAAANSFASAVALEITAKVFDVMGARSATMANGFDRFWRNVRVHTLHSPAEYKTQTVGSWFLTGAYPEPNLFQ